MPKLKSRIRRQIEMAGPMPLADYMHVCLADRQQGYYRHARALGEEGDFITAPETSQMFGELIGVWVLQCWQQLGEPEPFSLVEFGPGTGLLISDILRSTRAHPNFSRAMNLLLIETSAKLIEAQKKNLRSFDIRPQWASGLDHLPDMPTIAIGNEFLDALPFRQFVKVKDHWRERAITINENGNLIFGIGTGALDPTILPHKAESEPDGSVFEVSPAREAFIFELATHLSTNKGAALFIDYGHAETGFGETFQAVQNHRFVSPLEEPGLADLTSHVDFEPLAAISNRAGAHVFPIIPQGEFLIRMGLLERAGRLGHQRSPDIQAMLTRQVERLAGTDQMGKLFKVFAFSDSPINLAPFTEATTLIDQG